MKVSHRLHRRSFLATVIGGGATAVFAKSALAQQPYTGVTDSDTGQRADRPGYGTGVRNQYTDRDTGPNADPQFRGRGPQGPVTGQGSYGEPPSGCSDTDTGPGSDPGGRGRHCNGANPWPRDRTPTTTRYCTDSDRGASADPVQGGQHC